MDFGMALTTLGWPPKHLARLLGCSLNVIRNYARPDARVPLDVTTWLQRRVDEQQVMLIADPPPNKGKKPPMILK